MGLLKQKTRSVVGLDIEPGFLAAAEFSNGGSPTLVRAATGQLSPGLFQEGEVVDVDGLGEQLRSFFRENDLSRRVRLGLASAKVAVRVIELPAIEDDKELEAAVRFQAQEELPMPLEQAVLDHRVIERISDGEHRKMRVLVVGARRESVTHLLEAARRAGLVADLVDLSAFALIRALYVPAASAAQATAQEGEGASEGSGNGAQVLAGGGSAATMYFYVGGFTNLAVAVGTSCVFNRVLQNGVESMATTLAEHQGLTLDHARQWLRYVGLERDVETVEGETQIVQQTREVLESGTRRIADEIRLSVEYYHSTVPDARGVERAVMAGPGIAIGGLASFLERKLDLPIEPRSLGRVDVRPGALDNVDGSQLTVAAGLALEEVLL